MRTRSRRIVVTGAGGFIGQHLVNRLRADGHWVRGVDLKEPEYSCSAANEFALLDLREYRNCHWALRGGIDAVFQLAADMGGIGYITTSHAAIARNNTLVDAHMLEAARQQGVGDFVFASSACVYPGRRQADASVSPLREEDAYPADPERGYGWEKLYAEQLCSYYREDHGLDTCIVRLHNVYGPMGTYDGGKEKAPAALCRKIALARDGDTIEVWGDGEQARSFLFIDDCVEGLRRLLDVHNHEPVNLGSGELITVNALVDLIAGLAGKRIKKRHLVTMPQGVRGRNSDNARLRRLLGWEPKTQLRYGLGVTYAWIAQEMQKRGGSRTEITPHVIPSGPPAIHEPRSLA